MIRAAAVKRGYWGELETLARQAVAASAANRNPKGGVAALQVLATVEWRAGRGDAARKALQRAGGLALAHGDRKGEASSAHSLGWLAMRSGDPATALRHVTAALRTLPVEEKRIAVSMRHNRAEILLQLGRDGEAVAGFEECLEERRVLGDRLGESVTLSGLGRAYHLAGRHGDALAVLRVAVDLCRETGNREDEWEALLTASAIHLRDGEAAAAVAALEAAREAADGAGDHYGRAAVSHQLAHAYARAGAHAHAAAETQRARELYAVPGLRRDPIVEKILGV